jgi:hypothetical protein
MQAFANIGGSFVVFLIGAGPDGNARLPDGPFFLPIFLHQHSKGCSTWVDS